MSWPFSRASNNSELELSRADINGGGCVIAVDVDDEVAVADAVVEDDVDLPLSCRCLDVNDVFCDAAVATATATAAWAFTFCFSLSWRIISPLRWLSDPLPRPMPFVWTTNDAQQVARRASLLAHTPKR